MKRICTKCHLEQPITSFHRNKKGKEGRLNTCSACRNIAAKTARRTAHTKLLNKSYSLEWKRKNKDKVLAHKAVHRAIKLGRLKKRPCQVCRETDAQAHHEDYSRQLDVIWLCCLHHAELHKNHRGLM